MEEYFYLIRQAIHEGSKDLGFFLGNSLKAISNKSIQRFFQQCSELSSSQSKRSFNRKGY
jgi:hypothetical protein